jgi:hypothetical protein
MNFNLKDRVARMTVCSQGLIRSDWIDQTDPRL